MTQPGARGADVAHEQRQRPRQPTGGVRGEHLLHRAQARVLVAVQKYRDEQRPAMAATQMHQGRPRQQAMEFRRRCVEEARRQVVTYVER